MTDENRRTETARRHDDKPLTEGPATPDEQGRAGGELQTDVATQASEERVRDPEAQEGVTKEDKQQFEDRKGSARDGQADRS